VPSRRRPLIDFPGLSIVIPAYNEEANLPVLVAELTTVLEDAGVDFELVVVDDGSGDGTAAMLRVLAESDKRVRGLVLSRNFGHQAAISEGLRRARGRAVAVMDADLQDRPADLLRLYARWQAGADVVYAVRRSRPEGWLRRAAYRVFYRVLVRMADIPMPLDSGDFCVMDARVVRALNDLPERLRYVRGLRAWIGGQQVGLSVDRGPRRAGHAQYTVAKLCRLAVDGFVSFSYVPLRIGSILGFVISACALAGIVVVLLWKALGLLPGGAGLATIALSVLLLGGVQLLTIGILGEYVGRIFDEVKHRPVAIVMEAIGTPGGARGPES
jgi:polyisoprenyl-phosphate glycosyltransferase